MSAIVILSLKVYLLAIVISMVVAVAIRGIVLAVARSRPAAPPIPAPQAVVSKPPGQPDIAAIAATVYAIMGEHRIVSIRARDGGWVAGGRLSHHSSHVVSHHSQPR